MKQPLFSTSYAPRGGESTLDEIELTQIEASFSFSIKGGAFSIELPET